MVTTIETMTAEQEAKIPAHVDYWVKMGLATNPADFETAKKSLLELYKLTDQWPKIIVTTKSPYAAAVGGVLLLHFLERGLVKPNLPAKPPVSDDE
jgi:hypothetical protein